MHATVKQWERHRVEPLTDLFAQVKNTGSETAASISSTAQQQQQQQHLK